MKYLLLILSATIFINCTSSNAGSETDIAEIEGKLDAFSNIYAEKEIGQIDKLFSHKDDVLLYGVGASTWKGLKNIKKNIEKVIDEVDDSDLDVRDRVVHVSGDMAWFSEKGDWTYRFKGQRTELKDMRTTGVLRKENGKWVIVQWHSSIPAGG